MDLQMTSNERKSDFKFKAVILYPKERCRSQTFDVKLDAQWSHKAG